MKISRHGAIGLFLSVAFHQEIGGSPVRVAIEQSPDYSAIQHSGKGLVMRLGVPGCDQLVTFGKTPNMQTLFIRRPAAEADARG